MKYTSPYEAPTLTVDAVIFQLLDGTLSVALTKRLHEPFKGEWALPGGYNAKGETTREALERIVQEKAGIALSKDLSYVEQLYTFDTIARDPRVTLCLSHIWDVAAMLHRIRACLMWCFIHSLIYRNLRMITAKSYTMRTNAYRRNLLTPMPSMASYLLNLPLASSSPHTKPY